MPISDKKEHRSILTRALGLALISNSSTSEADARKFVNFCIKKNISTEAFQHIGMMATHLEMICRWYGTDTNRELVDLREFFYSMREVVRKEELVAHEAKIKEESKKPIF